MSRPLTTCRSECIGTNADRIGIVTNQPEGYDPRRSHAAETVCARPECLRRAMRNVSAYTGETATFVPDKTGGAR